MKKILLGTTGLIAVALLAGSPALANGVTPIEEPSAERIKLGLGGFMEQWVGWVDEESGGFREFDQKSDTEIYFIGSTTLDNGWTIMARVELEGDKGASGIDKSWLSISDESFGTLNLGSINTVTDNMHHYPPEVGIGLFDSSNWVVEGTATKKATGIDPGDHNVIQYVSPNWYGFQFGLEYAPDPDNIDLTVTPPTHAIQQQPYVYSNDYYAVVAAYNGEFEGFSVGFDVGFMEQNVPFVPGNREEYQVGASIGYGGFTVAGGYWYGNTINVLGEEDSLTIGASYEQGPWAVSATYQKAENWQFGHNDSFEQILLSGRYNLGPGVALKGTFFHVDAEDLANFGPFPGSNEGLGMVAGIRVDF